MPRFALPSVENGKTISSDAFRGKVLLVNFFATWCPPCRQEIPDLVKLQAQFASRGFTVIGISVDEGKGAGKQVKKFMDKRGVQYPVLMGDPSVGRAFGGISGIPISFLVNRAGKVVQIYEGYNPLVVLMNDVDQLASQP